MLLLFSVLFGRATFSSVKTGRLRTRDSFVVVKKENGAILFWSGVSLLALLTILFVSGAGLLILSVFND